MIPWPKPQEEFLFQKLQSWNEIIIKDSNNLLLIDEKGPHLKKGFFFPPEMNPCEFQRECEEFCAQRDQKWNFSSPYVSFCVPFNNENLRYTFIHESLTANKKSQVHIRRLQAKKLSLSDFSLSKDEEKIIKEIILKGENILICGGTGDGKTSFLQTLLHQLPSEENNLILEDTQELSSKETSWSHLVSSGQKEKTLYDLCHYALRMSPKRIILGEIRSKEVIPLLFLASSGHAGIMSTIHAKNAQEAISRLSFLYLTEQEHPSFNYEQAVSLVASQIQFVITIKEKKVKEMAKVIGHHQGKVYLEEQIIKNS